MVINRPSSYRQLLNICFWWWWYSQHAVTRYTVIENKNGIQSFHVQNKTLNLKWSLKNRNCNCFFNKHNCLKCWKYKAQRNWQYRDIHFHPYRDGTHDFRNYVEKVGMVVILIYKANTTWLWMMSDMFHTNC